MLITEKTEKNEKHPLFLKIVKLCIYFSPSQQKRFGLGATVIIVGNKQIFIVFVFEVI